MANNVSEKPHDGKAISEVPAKDSPPERGIREVVRDVGIVMVARKNPAAALVLHGVAEIDDMRRAKKAKKRKEKAQRRADKKTANKKGPGL